MSRLSGKNAFIRSVLVEFVLYACFVAAYFLLVLHLLSGWIDQVYKNNRLLYAILALALIAGQGIVLERVTSALLWLIDRLRAIVQVLRRLTRPHETVTRSKEAPGLLVYRFAGPLFFFNVDHFANRVREIVDSAIPPATVFLINAEAIVDMDADGAETLAQLGHELKERSVILAVCEAKGHFLEVLKDTLLTEEDGFTLYPSVAAAIEDTKKRKAAH